MNNENDLFQLFNRIASKGLAFNLLNVYKGMPISYEATITGIHGNTLLVSTNKYQIACLYMDQATYLQINELPGVIFAAVLSLNLQGVEAHLGNFQYTNKDIGKRGQVRVKPEEPFPVVLQLKNSLSPLNVSLADVSAGGVGVYLDRHFFHPMLYKAGVECNVILHLPETGQAVSQTASLRQNPDAFASRFSREQIRGILSAQDASAATKKSRPGGAGQPTSVVKASGRIMNIRPELHSGRYRLGIRLIQMDDTSHKILSQFVSQRQSEIIREIKTLYDLLAKFNQQGTG